MFVSSDSRSQILVGVMVGLILSPDFVMTFWLPSLFGQLSCDTTVRSGQSRQDSCTLLTDHSWPDTQKRTQVVSAWPSGRLTQFIAQVHWRERKQGLRVIPTSSHRDLWHLLPDRLIIGSVWSHGTGPISPPTSSQRRRSHLRQAKTKCCRRSAVRAGFAYFRLTTRECHIYQTKQLIPAVEFWNGQHTSMHGLRTLILRTTHGEVTWYWSVYFEWYHTHWLGDKASRDFICLAYLYSTHICAASSTFTDSYCRRFQICRCQIWNMDQSLNTINSGHYLLADEGCSNYQNL